MAQQDDTLNQWTCLISKHERDDLQHMHAPLLLTLSAGQELQKVIHPAHVDRPQQLIMYTSIIIHILQGSDN